MKRVQLVSRCRGLFRASPLLLVLNVSACGPEAGRSRVASVRDSAGIQIVMNPGPTSDSDVLRWTALEETSIGEIDGAEEYTFHRIRDVTVGPTGWIYVLDSGDQVIKAYDQDGQFAHRIGGPGDGPGEFRSASAMHWRGDTLAVYDFRLARMSYFSTQGEFLETQASSLSIPEFGIPGEWYPIPAGFVVVFSGGCRLPPPEDRRPMWKVLTTDLDGMVRDTLTIRVAEDVLAVYGERFCTATSLIGGAHHSLAILPNGIASYGNGREYEIGFHRLTAESGARFGGVFPTPFRVLRRDLDAVPIPSSAIDEYRNRQTAPTEGAPVDRERVDAMEAAWDSVGFPTEYPYFDELLWDDQGRLWVGRVPPPEGETRIWDIYNEDGFLIGEAELPRGLSVQTVAGEVVWGTMRDDLDLTYVKGFRLIPVSGQSDGTS